MPSNNKLVNNPTDDLQVILNTKCGYKLPNENLAFLANQIIK